MKAFVAGATGETGRRIVQQLVDRDIPVRAFVRDIQAAQTMLPTGIELVTGDLMNVESLKMAIGDSTVLFSATGARPSFDPQVLIKWTMKEPKILSMPPKRRELSSLSWCLLCVPQSSSILSICFG